MARTILDRDLARLDKKLARLARNIKGGKEEIGHKGGPLRKALMAGAFPIMKDMKAFAPVGKPKKARISKRTGLVIPARPGGLLRDSIRRETVRKPHLMEATEAVFIRPAPRKAPHFHLVEFGTSRMAPRPFMRPAYEKNKDDAFEIFKWKIEREIKRIEKKLSKQR